METCRSQIVCYNCFQQRDSLDGPCPHCGFDLAENEKKYPVALRAGTVVNGRYIVGRVLGQGGFGITYLAWDTQLEAKVAIKEFMPNEIATRIGTTVSVAVESRSEDFTYGSERFQEEARTLAKFIGNPNIAAVTSYFDENDTSYFVMDYIEGISFKTYIANHGGKVSVEDTLNVMIPVLRALTAVHQEGFIHRDVTPDNIYITKDGMVKLLDFGSARYSIGDKSKSLDVILKVGYAPKEQYIRRSRQRPFTDVYSCAACFYAALTGFLPPEALERLDHDELVPVSQCGVDIPEYLDKAILKGLAVQPEDRFQSAEEFLNAIESQQVVEVPQAGSAQPAAPTKKKLSPVLIGGVAAAVIAVAVGLGIAIGGGGNPSSAEEGAESENPIAEALAPTVTIGGEEYSTALTELELDGTALTEADYQTLQQFPDLTSLGISYPEGLGLSDLSPLSGLTGLTSLNVRTQGLASLDGIENLTRLEHLDLGGRGATFSSLEPLGSLTELRSLQLPIYDSTLEIYADLTPLANCTKLESLELDHKIADLAPLAGLTQLVSLDISDGYLGLSGYQTLEALSGLENLAALSLRNYNIRDLSGLEGAHALQNLYIETQNQLTDISALRDLEHLTNVTLIFDGDENLISDMSPLDHVPNVTVE